MGSPRTRGFRRPLIVLTLIEACLLFPARLRADSLLPLRTEAAAPLPSGTLEIVGGTSYFRNLRFPPFTPRGAIREQDLVSAPEIALRIGAGGWVEIQASYELLYLDERTVEEKHDEYGGGDVRLFTKVRLLREGGMLPGFGLRFGTKLPNANKDDRLGTDETDFGAEALASKDFGPLAAHVNLGIQILGNPGPVVGARTRSGDGQDDLFSYSIGLLSRPFGNAAPGAARVRIGAEVLGLAGSRRDFDNDRAAARLGARIESGGLAFYSGVSVGLEDGSEDFGVSAGFLYAFDLGRFASPDD